MVAVLEKASEELGRPELRKRARRIRDCQAYLACDVDPEHPGGARILPEHCDDALCPGCTGHRTRKVKAFVHEAIAMVAGDPDPDWRRVSFLTLTQRARKGESLRDARARLQGSWRAMRRDPWFQSWCRGGDARMEETWNEVEGWWHVHIHAIIWARYLPTYLLRQLNWHWASHRGEKAPGGARLQGVDAKAIRELLKYTLKVAGVPDARIVEWVDASKGHRSVRKFGTWHARKSEHDGEERRNFGADVVEVLKERDRQRRAERAGRFTIGLSELERLAAEGEHWAGIELRAVDRELAKREGRAARLRVGRSRRRGPPVKVAA